MSEKINKAMKIASKYHLGQKDKAGQPYIVHLLTVSSNCKTEDEMTVGLLHDIIEDTDCTISVIREEFGDIIAEAVLAITREEGESYNQYINRLKSNKIAIAVKIEDLKHNMDLSRLPKIREVDVNRRNKYKKTLNKLLEFKCNNYSK